MRREEEAIVVISLHVVEHLFSLQVMRQSSGSRSFGGAGAALLARRREEEAIVVISLHVVERRSNTD
jgi:hypothetical protein